MSDARLVELVDQLPTLPEVALRVVQLVGNDDYDVSELVQIVRTDPALTTRILKLCNSPLFSLRTPVTTVDGAVPFLGSRNLVKVAITTCTRQIFLDSEVGYGCRPGDFWRHGVASALAGSAIASRIGSVDPGSAFTAGILHNIGKVAIAPILAEESDRVDAALAEDPARGFLDIEKAIVGLDHSEVGAMVSDRWPLPAELVRAIVHHHDIENIKTDPLLTSVIHLADLLCLQLGIGVGIDGMRYPVSTVAMERTGLGESDLDELRVQLFVDVQRHEELINMSALASR